MKGGIRTVKEPSFSRIAGSILMVCSLVKIDWRLWEVLADYDVISSVNIIRSVIVVESTQNSLKQSDRS